MLNSTNFYPIAIAASIGFHVGLLGVSQILPTPAQFPVQQAPNSISVMLIQEAPAPELPKVAEMVVEEKPSEIQEVLEAPPVPTPVVKKEEEAQPSSQQSLGAVAEAAPLEFVNPAPGYPALARRRGWEGIVVVQVRVEKDGRPSSVAVAQSSGYQMLDDAALETIREWRFKPAQSGPIVFASTINIPIQFQLIEEK